MRGMKILAVLTAILSLTACGSNQAPVDSANNPDQSIKTTVMNNVVYFQFNNADVPANVAKLLTINASYLIAHPTAYVQIQGNSSEVGTIQHNQELALQRAQSVSTYLTSQGVDSSHLSVRGAGPDQPIASNADANGRAQNRRVEVNLKPIPGQQYEQYQQ